ncbi:MAG: phage head morphogenesis protein [Gemmatimonadaceae bacterium]
MPITPETVRLAEQLRQAVNTIVDTTARSLTAAWVRAWDEVVFEVVVAIGELLQLGDGKWPSRAQIFRAGRAMGALDVVASTLERLATLTRTTATTAAGQAARLAAEGQGPLVASQLPYGSTQAYTARYKVQQPDTIDAIVRRTAERINASTIPLSADATERMKRELIRGVVVGDNPRTAAARMVKNLEGEFNGGLTRALVISRTEIIDAHRSAAEVTQDGHDDVLGGWVWHAELNSSRGRTCPSCWAKHGTIHPLSEPGPIDHQQGRCSRTPKTKSWAELGFDIDEPPDATPNAREVFDNLPQAERLQIMGARRLELLDAGAIEWADLPQLRTTPEWRDSYGVRPVYDLERIAKAR